jgi:hypothetical protein
MNVSFPVKRGIARRRVGALFPLQPAGARVGDAVVASSPRGMDACACASGLFSLL